jgi:hypothetical protein
MAHQRQIVLPADNDKKFNSNMKTPCDSVSRLWRGMAQMAAWSWLAAGLLAAQTSSALTVTSVTSDNGYPALQVQWTDGAGLPRTAILVKQNATTAPYTGYLRRYTYQVNGQSRVCTGTDNFATGGNLEFSGDGFVQNHTASSVDYPNSGDFSSGNGAGVPGTTTVTLQGTSHAIITFTMPSYQIQTSAVPTTVQWFFADGRSHPIFAISQDARATTANLAADSRSPYGDMAYDGDGTGAFVGGCSYGDTYKFVTLAANEVTTNSGWQDTQTNTIPYAMQWANPATVDAEMGHVATVPISVCDQGEDPQNYPVVDGRGASQPNGPMLTDESWAFQILNDNWPASGPTTTKRLTWGGCYGRVGGWDDSSPGYTDPRYPDSTSTSLTQYNQHYNDPLGETESGTRANGLLMAYSVFIVFGTHTGGYTNGTVGQQVIQMQNAALATLSASVGKVATNGPSGVGNASSTNTTYTPAGYDPIYSTWDIAAVTNTVNVTLTPAASYPLVNPVFLINGYTSNQLPAGISVGAGLTTNGVNFYASVDTNGQRLWITVNRTVSNALNLVITNSGGGGATPAPVISSIPASGAIGTLVAITGQNLTNATAVSFNGAATSFMVNSTTQITAYVPPDATTGLISVTTPGGTGQSATSFTVLPAIPNLPIYTNSGLLLNQFQNYSWATNVNFSNASPVFLGGYSIGVTAAQYTALSLYYDELATAPFASLSFWINGGAAGASGLQVFGVTNVGTTQNYAGYSNLPALAPNTWTQFNIPLSALGVSNITNCQGFWFWPSLAGATTFYLETIQLDKTAAPSLSVTGTALKSGSFVLQLSGLAGQTYWMQTSTNLTNWTSVSTNVLMSSPVNITNMVIPNAGHQYFRAVLP